MLCLPCFSSGSVLEYQQKQRRNQNLGSHGISNSHRLSLNHESPSIVPPQHSAKPFTDNQLRHSQFIGLRND